MTYLEFLATVYVAISIAHIIKLVRFDKQVAAMEHDRLVLRENYKQSQLINDEFIKINLRLRRRIAELEKQESEG
jgi:selenocysteine-specific translation elongation factor